MNEWQQGIHCCKKKSLEVTFAVCPKAMEGISKHLDERALVKSDQNVTLRQHAKLYGNLTLHITLNTQFSKTWWVD